MATTKLIDMYQQMADMTRPKCGNGCGSTRVGGCCEEFYCHAAMAYAEERFGIELKPTEHASVPLLSESGSCTAAPYLRPMCTLHVCKINSLGFLPDDPKWTKAYFRLRDKISHAEAELECEKT